MDAKYKPGYSPNVEGNPYGLVDDIREISGYARDERILKRLKLEDGDTVPMCLIIYPEKDGQSSLCDIESKWQKVNNYVKFYSVGIALPTWQIE